MTESRREISLWRFGDEPCPYTLISEPKLTLELERLSGARIIGRGSIGTTACVSLQPNLLPENANQDRYVVREFAIGDNSLEPESMWKLRVVFDGHLGHQTVDHAAENLPRMVESRLQACTSTDSNLVSQVLSETIQAYDDSLLSDLYSAMRSDGQNPLSEEEVRDFISDCEFDFGSGGQDYLKVLRCMQGTTVVLVLTSPDCKDLWVASLGDSYTVLGLQRDGHHRWEAIPLSSCHNGRNIQERERLSEKHPNEPEVVIRNRVLGAMSLTRAVGDFHYKLPQLYTDRLFMNVEPGWSRSEKRFVNSFIGRNLTPPYISNIPDVRYVNLRLDNTIGINGKERRMCLLMCTDGLADLYEDENDECEETDMFRRWIEVAAGSESNGALALLRDALGGTDEATVSSMLTAEIYDKWMDDTTILFEFL
ncbi:hypothetical protein GYMLUDRAFT_46785 [Collybiopsis luxurians FD-317 M1]|uniref:PPM-type phosphatase domain-containing protein n=1 Tax=Collybiopsis luxurians FD-317 M1 TaxID=944289 RepID=A0A0D0C3F5_9AGAR|nr:hypothetical protein GYMLUDRAFT_46785 [Collybiopsis luxurians FD-317 M1]